MAWIILFFAGLFEVAWAYCMKLSDGVTRFGPTSVMVVTMLASIWLLAIAMRSLPLGTAYMVWTGIGALGSFTLGVVLLGEAVNPMRLAAAALILAGIALMKLAS